VIKLDPLSIRSTGHLKRATAIPTENARIQIAVKMNGPLTVIHLIPAALFGLGVVAGQEKALSLRNLQVIPDSLSICIPKFMSNCFAFLRSGMYMTLPAQNVALSKLF
jgi:hypothetical protein